jgi:hypothetical protein
LFCSEVYTTPNGKVKVEIYLQDETIWLTQQKIAELFGVQRPAVTKHLKNIFDSGELKEELVCSILEHTTPHGALPGKTQDIRDIRSSERRFYQKITDIYAQCSADYRAKVNLRNLTESRIVCTKVILIRQ